MEKLGLLITLVTSVGCSAAAPSPNEVPPSTPAPPTTAAASATGAPVAPTTTGAAAGAGHDLGAQVAPECRGSQLDLNAIIIDAKRCPPAPPRIELEAGALAVSAAPAPITLGPGKPGELTLTLTNTGATALALDIPFVCGEAFGLAIQSSDGAQLWGQCKLRRLCVTEIQRIVLDGNGTARVRLPFSASKRELDSTCTGVASSTPLEPGTYTVRVNTHLTDPDGNALFGTSTLYVK